MVQHRWIGIAQFLGVVALLPWGLLALFSPMAFDSGDFRSPLAMFIYALWAYPAVLIAASVATRRYASSGREQAALIAITVPLVYLALLMAMMYGIE